MSGKKILVADDESLFVEILVTKLSLEGYVVCSAGNGEEAIARALSEKPDLILMDVMMPRISGYEAMLKIRLDPRTRGIPAIVFSAKEGMKEFFAGMSGVEFLPKPFNIELLPSKIEAILSNSQPRTGQSNQVVLLGVDEFVMNKVRDFLKSRNFQVLIVLNEREAIALAKKIRPGMIVCQLWEDENVLDPRKIAQELLPYPAISNTPLYVYCKEALSVEAMKCFRPERIITYKETSDLLRKLETTFK